MRLILTLSRAIAALHRHGFEDAALALEIELSLLIQGRVSDREARTQANQFLSLLAN